MMTLLKLISNILDTFHSCNLDAPQNIGKEIAVAKCDAIDLKFRLN